MLNGYRSEIILLGMKNYTDLNIIVDRSGSMSGIARDMEGGIETFLETERKTGDHTVVSYFTFDNEYETIFLDKKITEDMKIEIKPRGFTALFDAVGKTITTVGEKLAAMKEEDRPNRVLFMVITDGEENSSKEFTKDAVKQMIKSQRETFAWDFAFLGTTEDVMLQGSGMGIAKGSSLQYEATQAGILRSFLNVSSSYQSYKHLDRRDMNTRCQTIDFNDAAADPTAKVEPQDLITS